MDILDPHLLAYGGKSCPRRTNHLRDHGPDSLDILLYLSRKPHCVEAFCFPLYSCVLCLWAIFCCPKNARYVRVSNVCSGHPIISLTGEGVSVRMLLSLMTC